MKPAFLTLFALPALMLAACTTTPPIANDGFARLGQSTRVSAMTIRPDSIVEDSRCPMNARCVWAGRVVVATTVWSGGQPTMRNLTLGEPASDGLMLDRVEPGRMTQTPLTPKDYRFHFSMQPYDAMTNQRPAT